MRGTAQNPGIVGASRSFMQTCPDLWAEVKGKPVFFSPLPHECVFGENEETSKICAEAVRKEKKKWSFSSSPQDPCPSLKLRRIYSAAILGLGSQAYSVVRIGP